MFKMIMKRLTAVLLMLVMMLGIVPAFSVSAAYENTHVNTGNQAYDIVAVAKTQVGYTEGSNNDTKYNRWFGSLPSYGYNYAWCQTFVAWCANQAGISTSDIARVSGTVSGMDSYKNNGTWHNGPYYGASYTPKQGDIIYFKSSASNSGYHVGIVSDCYNGTVYTIEGNAGSSTDRVITSSYSVSSTKIVGYGVPFSGAETFNDPYEVSQYLFDAEFYYCRYTDLQEVIGYDDAALYNHWLTYGISEGRTACANFDLKYYLENNSDLLAAYGNDYVAAYNHFLTYGCNEDFRKLSPIYDTYFYTVNHSDLVSHTTVEKFKHFLEYGIHEGRMASAEFNPTYYRKANTELISEFGDNWKYYYWHYLFTGKTEGRSGNGEINATPVLSITPNSNLIDISSDITFSWTSCGKNVSGYNLYIAPVIAGTIEYDWSNARGYVPGCDSLSFTYDAGRISAGSYAAYVQAWNIEADTVSEPSNFIYFVVEDNNSPLSGDLTQDNATTITDAVALQKYLLAIKTLTAEQKAAADMNSDGRVNVFDLNLLKAALK